MRKLTTGAVTLAALAIPTAASAGSFSATFNFNNGPPTFNPVPTYPLVPTTISYDPSGALTVVEGGGSPLWTDDVQQGWANIGVQISGPSGPEGSIDDHLPGYLSVDGIEGSLQGSTTTSGDTQTTTYTSPLIAGLSWDYVEADPYSPFPNNQPESQESYFAGSGPVVTVPQHGSVTDQASDPDDVELDVPTVLGVAKGAPGYGTRPTLSATGLPPGISLACNRTACELGGTPSRAGSFKVTLRASFPGAISAAPNTFSWRVSPAPLPEVVTDLAANHGIERKPAVIGISGDGSWWFGGPTGREFEKRTAKLRNLGHLVWTSYTAHSARGHGVVWDLYGPGSFASDRRFQRQGPVSIYEYRPINGVFTRELASGRLTYRDYYAPGRSKIMHSRFNQLVKPVEYHGRWAP